jgi:hypothetical protein
MRICVLQIRTGKIENSVIDIMSVYVEPEIILKDQATALEYVSKKVLGLQRSGFIEVDPSTITESAVIRMPKPKTEPKPKVPDKKKGKKDKKGKLLAL